MAELPFIDGFSYYPTSAFNRKWTNVQGDPVIQSVVINDGPRAMQCADNDQVHLATADITEWVFGFKFRIDGFARAALILQVRDDPGGTQCSLRVNQNSTLEVIRGISFSVAGGASTLTLNSDTWYHIEMIVTIDSSIPAGSCEVRVNGATWITVDTGEDLTTSGSSVANLIKLGSSDPLSTQELYFESFYALDATGGGVTFLGDSRVQTLLPNANGATNQFDGSDGNSVDNFELVNESVSDDDSTFVESDTVGHIDLYGFDDLTVAKKIHVVQNNSVVKKDDAGARTTRLITRPVSTNFFSASKSPSAGAYSNEIQVFDNNPETSLPWTTSQVNAAEFGVEIDT